MVVLSSRGIESPFLSLTMVQVGSAHVSFSPETTLSWRISIKYFVIVIFQSDLTNGIGSLLSLVI